MTAKALHKKITDTNMLAGRKHEKRNPSNRAILSDDAQREINQGIDNPVELCLCEHLDSLDNLSEDEKENHAYFIYGQKYQINGGIK